MQVVLLGLYAFAESLCQQGLGTIIIYYVIISNYTLQPWPVAWYLQISIQSLINFLKTVANGNSELSTMDLTLDQIKNQVNLKDAELSFEEKRQLHLKWRSMPSTQKIAYFMIQLRTLVVTLLSEKVLNEQKLSKLLSLNLTLDEAMTLQLTNYYAYLMDLIRKNTTNTARNYLNQLTDQISKYEDLLHKKIEKEVQRYRELDKDQDDISQEDDQYNYDSYTRNYDPFIKKTKPKEEFKSEQRIEFQRTFRISDRRT